MTAYLPIALGVVMVEAGSASIRESFALKLSGRFHRGRGGLEVAAGLLLLIPETSRFGAVGSAAILLAALATLIRHRNWSHLPAAAVLTATAAAAIPN